MKELRLNELPFYKKLIQDRKKYVAKYTFPVLCVLETVLNEYIQKQGLLDSKSSILKLSKYTDGRSRTSQTFLKQ